MLTIHEITSYLETLAPLSSQESYDNCGLIVGDSKTTVNAALVTLDCTEEVILEAKERGIPLVIAHHPIVFSGLKKLNGKNYVERAVIAAIKHDIAIYAIHTNLDNYVGGVNYEIGTRLGLQHLQVLQPKSNVLHKLVVFCPTEAAAIVSQAMFDAGAGHIGNYDQCSFETNGVGAFRPLDGAQPVLGELGQREKVSETRIEMLCSKHVISRVISAMKQAHPYEEVAYDCYQLENQNSYEGAGMIGELPEQTELSVFLKQIKAAFNCGVIRHTTSPSITSVKKVAFCGGSGAFLIGKALAEQADIYITGDLKYHEFFDAEDRMILADIGHYESEQFTPNLLKSILKKKFINFAVHFSEVKTNPVNYF
jgi:dinuclear metal center YbgI/SA1388 family protein